MVTLARTSTGLLYQSDGSLTGWTGTSQWTTVTATRLVASPAVPISPGANANQVKGEPKWEQVGASWYFSYDNIFTGTQSVPGIQVSNDRGLSWEDLGQLKFSSAIPGAGAAVVSFFLDPVSSDWHLNLLTGTSVFNGTGLNGPFQQYIYKSTTGILGPYTQINEIGPNPGSWCNSSSSSGSCFWDGTNYWQFSGGTNSISVAVTGTWKATTLAGTFVQTSTSTPLFDVTVNGPIQTGIFSCENATYGHNSALGFYVLAVNSDITNGTDDWSWGTMVQTATDGVTFSTSGWKTIQWVCPADAPNVILDVTQFLHNGANNLLAVGPNGEMASVFSTQKAGGPYTPEYSNLQSRMAVIEPASNLIRYTGAGDAVYRQLVRSLSHTDITIECGAELTGIKTDNNSGEFHVIYRSDGTAANEYRAVLGTNTQWRLDKVVGNVRTILVTGSGSQSFANLGATLGYIHRFKVQVIGNVHKAWLDGELQYTFTDSSLASGTSHISLAGIGVTTDTINLTARTSDTITVHGMQPSTSLWLRAACGIPIMPIVANTAGAGTATYQHFPAFSLDIGGTDYTVGSDSRIWGGDVLTFSGLPPNPPATPISFNNT